MTQRLDPYRESPQTMAALLALEQAVRDSGLEQRLIDLVKIRASQLNGCAFCVHMHTRDARKHGETEERIYLLDVWREAPVFTPRERAALGWTEALTLVSQTHAPDADYEPVREHFSPKEQADLTLLIGTINVWNRLGVGFRKPVPAASAVEA